MISLSSGLNKKGHNCFIASSGGQAEEKFRACGITLINIPINTKCEVSPKILISFLKLKKELRTQKIDIIHANTRVTQVLGAIFSRFCNYPYISTCHGFFKKRFFRMVFPAWGDRVIAISKQVADNLERDFKIDKEMISIIHNGIDYQRFSSNSFEDKKNIKKSFNLSQDGPVVGMIARLSDVKGHTFFIQAMPQILNAYPKSCFVIAGEGRLKEKLKNEVNKLSLSKSVFFLPSQPDTSQLLSVMDCVVTPSIEEGLGLSIIEAQAVGVPVVAFSIGGIPSLIEHNKTGLLVGYKDVNALAQAVIKILSDEGLRRNIINQARENIKQKFSQDLMVDETLKAYMQVLNKK